MRKLTDQQLSMVLGNAREHVGRGRAWPSHCSCAGAVALGYKYFDDIGYGHFKEGERATAISDALFGLVRIGISPNRLYRTPDALLSALERAGLA